MAEEGEEETSKGIQPSFPTGRVKRIVKIDNEINKLTSEALFLISASAELFLQFLAERSAEVAIEKKRKTVKLEHVRTAVNRHRPTSDFLLDSLPMPSDPEPNPDRPSKAQPRSRASTEKPIPSNVRRIDSFFRKSDNSDPVNDIEKENEESEQRLDDTEKENEESEQRLDDTEKENQESEHRLNDAEKENQESEQRLNDTEKENEESEQRE